MTGGKSGGYRPPTKDRPVTPRYQPQPSTPRPRQTTRRPRVDGTTINPCEHAFEAIAVLRQEVFLFMGQVCCVNVIVEDPMGWGETESETSCLTFNSFE